MKKTIPLLMIGGALVLAGCASKQQPAPAAPPPPAPPPAVEQPRTVPPPETPRVAPGSQAALIEAAGSDTVHFAFDRYDIDAEARAILTRQANWLRNNPNVRVMIEGNCDERGTREYNLALGERRAIAVKNFLVAQGIPTGRISTISYGKERPIALGSDEASWAQNRRALTAVQG